MESTQTTHTSVSKEVRNARRALRIVAGCAIAQWTAAVLIVAFGANVDTPAGMERSLPGNMAHLYGKLLPFVVLGSLVTCGVSVGALYTAHILGSDHRRASSSSLILSILLVVCTLPCCWGLLNVALVCAVLSTVATWRLRKALHTP